MSEMQVRGGRALAVRVLLHSARPKQGEGARCTRSQWFYEEQLHRMECLSQESVAFADVVSQLQDMLSPQARVLRCAAGAALHAAGVCVCVWCVYGCNPRAPTRGARGGTVQEPAAFSLADLRRTRPLSGTLFNILFNLNKFVAFETRDPFALRQASGGLAAPRARAPPASTSLPLPRRQLAAWHAQEGNDGEGDWHRFAKAEYVRLATEDDDCGESAWLD